MLKMFSTQLAGLIKRIQEQNEFAFEDGARLIAQAAVGAGNIYIYGENEMNAIMAEAKDSAEPFTNIRQWDGKDETLTVADRVIIFSRFSDDPSAVKAGKWLLKEHIPFVAVSTHLGNEGENLAKLADVHIDLQLKKALLPDEEGNRFGYPASMAALFAYYGLTFTLKEILADY